MVEDPVHLHVAVQVEMPQKDLRDLGEYQILVVAAVMMHLQ